MRKNSKISKRLLLAFACLGIIFLTYAIYKKYIEDESVSNSLIHVREKGNVKLVVRYKPASELRTNGIKEDSTQRDFDKFIYFILSISVNNKDLESNAMLNGSYSKDIETFCSGMNSIIKATIDGSEVVEMTDYFYSRMYGSTSSTSFMIVFDRDKLKNKREFNLFINYPELNILNEKFSFSIKDIENF